jgi:Ala-tRNA(Pro) deacylase
MAIAMTLKDYLDDSGVDYNVIMHTRTGSNTQTAAVANIPGEQLAKSVMLEDGNGHYMLAVIPSNQHVDLDKLHHRYKSHVGLTKEEKLGELFDDCELGALPVTGEAYGFNVVWDDKLADCKDIYFEAGDHMHLVHTTGTDFQQLMSGSDHCKFTTLS